MEGRHSTKRGRDETAVTRGRGEGDGGKLGGSVCNKCKLAGHIAKKCKTVCDVCGDLGHAAASCPTKATCGHCERFGHNASRCDFGARIGDRSIKCGKTDSTPCFNRYFLVPMQRASAEFDVDRLRVGRADVGMRCITASLFRSQSLRTNTQVFLGFGASQRVVQVSGALVRELRPDERSLAERVRSVSASEGFRPDVEIAGADLRSWSQSLTRGFYSFAGSTMDALKRLLDAPAPKPTVMLLTAAGKPIEDVIGKLVSREGSLDGGLIVFLGDDRGIDEEGEQAIRSMVKEVGAGKVLRASLGGDVLFASHSIVLVNHYLDKLAHSCELRQPRSY